jgi:hypothetical protein
MMPFRYFPQSQPRNGLEVSVKGNDDGTRFQGMCSNPDIVYRQGGAGLF